MPQRPVAKKTQRQLRLTEMAERKNWNFKSEYTNDLKYFESFYFFKTRPIEERLNTVTPNEKTNNWEICDVSFEEGAYEATDEYHTTVCLVKATKRIPKFVIEKKSFTDIYLNTSWHKDIDYSLYRDFSKDFIVKVENSERMKNFLSEEIHTFIINGDINHLESNGEAIMIFNDNLRLAQTSDYSEIVKFAEELEMMI
jgi:hypothetical protein